jgi:hypothetical protein
VICRVCYPGGTTISKPTALCRCTDNEFDKALEMLNGPEESAALEAAATLTQERIEKAKQKRRARRREQAEQDMQGFQDEAASGPQEVRAEALWLLM